MANIDHLYNDPNWLLQAGLADIEHEQFMYDQIMYGDPVEQPEWKRIELLKSMQMEPDWMPLADYDELALMGLRHHSSQGPYRYLYNEEEKKNRKKGYLGQSKHGYPNQPNKIDLNLRQVLEGGVSGGEWDPDKGSLQDYISDIYRHEYKHPLFSKRVNNFMRDKTRINDPSHAAIHTTGSLYGKSRQAVERDFNVLKLAPDRSPHVGAILTEYARRQNPHLNRRYKTGGIVSLML